jgi:outer membrane receptor protein involved in Fe transport
MFDWYHQRQNPAGFRPFEINGAVLCGVYPLDCPNGTSQAAARTLSLPLDRVDIGDRMNINDGTYWGITNTTSLEVASQLTIRNIFGYRKDRTDAPEEFGTTYLPVLTGVNHDRARQTTDELSFMGTVLDGGLHYTVGTYYADSQLTDAINFDIFSPDPANNIYGVFGGGGGLPEFPIVIPGVVNFAPVGPVIAPDTIYVTRSKAVFSQVDYNIIGNLSLTLGGRYTVDDKQVTTSSYTGYTDSSFSALRCTSTDYAAPSELIGPCAFHRGKTFHAFTWNGSLNFKPDEKTLVYVSVARGYQSGGFNAAIREPQYRTYDPEKVLNAELGLKRDWRLDDRPIRTNVAIFRAKYDNQQRLETGGYADGHTFSATINAASSTIWGAELDVNYLPTTRTELSLNYSYVNARYNRFTSPAIGTSVARDLSGLQTADTPKDTVNATVSYTLPTNDAGAGIRPSLSVYYRSPIFFSDLQQDTFNHGSGYVLFNGRIDLIKVLSVDVGVWMNNIANKVYAIYKVDNLSGLGYASAVYGAPRTYGIDVTARF